MEQAPQGSGYSRIQEFGQYPWVHNVTLRDDLVHGQELDLMMFVGPFKLSLCFDSVNITKKSVFI